MLVGYNAQLAVDAKHKLIAADDVTNGVTDYQQLANVALGNRSQPGIETSRSGGRRGLLQRGGSEPVRGGGPDPLIRKADTSANTARGLYGKSRFGYDANKDVYVARRARS